MGIDAGKPRNPWVVLLLIAATLGVYWFVWLRRGFGEVAGDRPIRVHIPPRVTLLALLWAFGLVFFVLDHAKKRSADAGFGARVSDYLSPDYSALHSIGLGFWAAFFFVQMMFLRDATGLAAEAAYRANSRHIASPALAVLMGLLGMAAQVPFVGIYLLPALAAVAVAWIYQVQLGLNDYWHATRLGPPRHGSQPTSGPPA